MQGQADTARIDTSLLCPKLSYSMPSIHPRWLCLPGCSLPQCVSERVWCTFPFLQREIGNLKKSQVSLKPGKAVGSSVEEIWSYDFRLLQVNVRNSRELQADKQAIAKDHI